MSGTGNRVSTLDQLSAWWIYRLTQAVTDAKGRVQVGGTEFLFSHAILNEDTGSTEIHGYVGAKEVMFRASPGLHRALFEPTWREGRPPAATPARIVSPPPPDPANWVKWLGEQKGFEEAARLLVDGPSYRNWGSARQDADVLRRAAQRLFPSQPTVARWLADRSLTFYHCWMSQATSGGEGTAMQYEVRSDLADLREILDQD